MYKNILLINKKKTNNSVGKWAKGMYGEFTEMR